MQKIRFHGRGGQGAVIGSEVLAHAFFHEGKYVQAFPAFGVERRGAPVTAFCRIDNRHINLRNQIYTPDHVIVLDASLLNSAGVTQGLKDGGSVLVNGNRSPARYRDMVNLKFKIYVVDAARVAVKYQLGTPQNPIVNTAILGAFARATGLVSIEAIEKAIAETVPFYEDKIPACQNACPAGNDIEGWIRLIQKGDLEAAYWHLKREEPFPAILGRVCFRFCQQVCSRASFDSCVNIRELERYVGESAPVDTTHPDLGPEKGKRLAVVGSGPAGMSAAYFGRLLGFSVVLFEARSEPGGLLRVGIPGYRLPRRIVAAEFEALRRMGIRVRCATTIGTQIAFSELRSKFDYILLATGNRVGLKMRIAGEDKCPRILSGLALLEQVAMGKKPDLGRQMVVVGGGNTAIDAARTAVRLGCAATVLYRRTEEQMPAHGQEVCDARAEGVRFRFLTAPERIDLYPDGSIRSLICSEMMLGTIDDSGRPRALPKPDSRLEICADTVLTAIGEAPSFDYLAGAVSIDKSVLAVNSGLQVCLEDPGRACIFAGGDIIDTPHTVVHAVATGKRAAIAMDCDSTGRAWHRALDDITIGSGPALSFSRYLDLKPVTPTRRNWRKVVGQQRIVLDYFKRTPPAHIEIQPPSARVTSFRPYSSTYPDKTARQEAARCLHCGRCTECDNCLVFCPDLSVLKTDDAQFGYRVDYDYCKGCGICFTECPRDAITMVDEDNVIEPEES